MKNWKAAVYVRRLRGTEALCGGAVINDLACDPLQPVAEIASQQFFEHTARPLSPYSRDSIRIAAAKFLQVRGESQTKGRAVPGPSSLCRGLVGFRHVLDVAQTCFICAVDQVFDIGFRFFRAGFALVAAGPSHHGDVSAR